MWLRLLQASICQRHGVTCRKSLAAPPWQHEFSPVDCFWAVLPVCLRPTVHVPNSSDSFVTATKPLLTPPSRVCLERITLAHIMQEFFIFYGFVNYFNFCLNKGTPFVPVLIPPPYVFNIIFNTVVPSTPRFVSALFPHQILCAFKPQCKRNSRTKAVLAASCTDCIHVFWKLLLNIIWQFIIYRV
jgi:hypothetical protein